ncbi:alkylphosphocholine resistance protein lem3 [Elasticomyces elasticus]|nr:alkylphosphocholine resistance protein lem3 [Elasticomyces elasticus]
MSQTMEQTDGGSMREDEEPEKKQKSRRPPNTAFRQQRLKAWQPILTPKTVLPLLFGVGVIFAPIGGLLLWASSLVQEISIDYSTCAIVAPLCVDGTTPPTDNATSRIPESKLSSYFKNTTSTADAPTWCRTTTSEAQTYGGARNIPNTTICHIQFFVPDTLDPPVLLYYQLTNFYQNHRRYVKSFSQDQLSGTAVPASTINGSDCSPLEGEATPDGWKPYYPCGLIANSRFNDTILSPVLLGTTGSSATNQTYQMTHNDTAWGSDADLYKQTKYVLGEAIPPPNWRQVFPEYNSTEGFGYPNLNTDYEFQVWMRTAGLPNFSKLKLRNDDDKMIRGRYQVDIYDCENSLGIPRTRTLLTPQSSDFPVTLYSGTKTLLISTRTVMGGRNPFLGIAYVVVGGLCVLLGALFTATQLIKPRLYYRQREREWLT